MSNATTAKSELGARCPNGGNLYICHDHPSRFVGCCKTDPCKSLSGRCAARDLTPMTYDEDKHDLISAQECQASFNTLLTDNDDGRRVRREDDDFLWYACGTIDPPFMGCCKSNPCNSDGCPKDDLGGAKVTNDTIKAWPFFGEKESATTTTSSTSAPTTSATSEPTSDPGTGGLRQPAAQGLSAGATAGIAGGTAFAVIFLIAIVIWLCWRKSKRSKRSTESPRDQGQTQHPLMADSTYGHTPTNSQHVSSPRTPLNSTIPSDGHVSQQSYYSYQPQLAELHQTDVDRGPRSAPMSGMYSPPYWSGTQWVYPRHVSVMPTSAPPHVQHFKVADGRDREEQDEPVELPCDGEGGRVDRQSWGVGDDNQRLTEFSHVRSR